MDNKRIVQNLIIIILGIAIIIMTVGYAAYSTTLEINGDATAIAAKWDIHFDKLVEVVKPTGTTTSSIDPNKKLVTFDTTLKVNEKYQFKVDVVNDGTFDAKLDSIVGSGYYEVKNSTNTSWLPGQTPITVTNSATGELYKNNYIKYTLTYDTGTALVTGVSGDPLTKKGTTGDTRTLLVTVEYFQPTNEADLPPVDTKYHFELDLKYVQN